MKDEVIYKYPIPDLTGEFVLEIPEGFTVINIAMQGNLPVLWAIVDPKAKLIKQPFKIISTGIPIGIENGCYVGTYQLYGGELVRHVFEIYTDNEDDDYYSEENEKAREEQRLKELKSTEEDVMELEELGFNIQKFSDYHYRINGKIDYWPTANKIRPESGKTEIMYSKPQLVKRVKELLKD